LSSSSVFDVQIAQGVDEIGQAAWDHLAGDRPFASYRWYRFGEALSAADKPVYIVLSHKGEPVARATFWIMRDMPLPIPSRIARRLMETLFRRRPVLLCQSPWWSVGPGLILPDPPLHDTALTTIIRAAWEQAQQRPVSFLAFDYLEPQQAEWSGWPDMFMPSFDAEPGTRLVIAWPDFESYMHSSPKSTRKDYHQHCNHAAKRHIRVRRHPAAVSLDEAMVLMRNVERHHDAAHNAWIRPVLENASLVDATWLTAEIDGRLVGCGLLIGDGATRLLTFLGLDYSVQYAYFQLFYEGIRCAIEEGAHTLEGGSAGYELKQRLGFQLECNNRLRVAATNRALRWIGRRLSGT
jgi:predicted N-acyltransferase